MWKGWLSPQIPVDLKEPHRGGLEWWGGAVLIYCKCSDTWVFGSMSPPKAKKNERQGLSELGHNISGLVGWVKYN